ncbi:chemotaxis protein CheR [Myxococcus sp. K15C18031901]|uniref:CheR family methyltransferase n=1 Tax=Myxococcus dinghuensis TaxID=2906761 RepID=UPI0020A80BC7|nr:CheR family methyltransferase [Myxococcus dinghuensis]MCP3099635.1 chemotaxis protein CheR [Myxococcus dinghuensis]
MSHATWSHPGFPSVLALVEERAGLSSPSCPASAEEGISRAMARAGLSDFDAYRARITADPAAMDDLLTELTIGETYFFRTPEHYEHLRRVILPELRERFEPARRIRLWSAACASGEEPYSMAALLMNEGWGGRMEVHASDVSRAALNRARRAQYGEWSLRGPWADRMRPYLQQEGRHYLLSQDVKQAVRFSYLNLALDTWPSADSGIWKLDVIFCRNVLIYFNPATVAAVARRLHDALDEGGYLFMGPSDPPLGGLAPFETLLTEWGVLYRRPRAGAVVAVPLSAPVDLQGLGKEAAHGAAGAPMGAPSTHVDHRPADAEQLARAVTSARPGPRSRPAPLGGGTKGAAGDAGRSARGALPGRVPNGSKGALFSGVTPDTARDARRPDDTRGATLPRAGGGSGAAPASTAPSGRPEASTRSPTLSDREGARRALERGDWHEAATRMGALDKDPSVAAEAVRAIANLDAQAALYASAEAASRHPLVPELRYLEALFLLGQGRFPDAERAVRQALYLEPTLAVAWLVLGRVLGRLGDTPGALKALHEAEALCEALPSDTPLPLGDGERAGMLAGIARAERERWESSVSPGEVP